jgi:hypothetical protein
MAMTLMCHHIINMAYSVSVTNFMFIITGQFVFLRV